MLYNKFIFILGVVYYLESRNILCMAIHTNNTELEAACDKADRSNCDSLKLSWMFCNRADFLSLIIDWVLPCTPAVI